jgi:hypothetical protein
MPQHKTNIKHNKKRNAGLLYEWLVSYVTELVAMQDDNKGADLCVEMMVRYFDKGTDLGKELQAIRSLSERKYNPEDRALAAAAISEFKVRVAKVNLHQSNIEKSNLIKEINHTVSSELYDKGADDYRLYASISGLIEALKREDFAEQAFYESMILSNLVEQASSPNKDTEALRELSEEDRALALSGKFLEKMGGKIREKLNVLTPEQESVLENWDAWHRGEMNEELYRQFLHAKLPVIESVIDLAIERESSEITKNGLIELKQIYTKEACIPLSSDSLTEHVLEGFGLKRLINA